MPFVRLLLLCCVMSLTATSARAAGMSLNWNDCGASPLASPNKNFACNSNVGASNTLVVSFAPPDGVSKLVGMSAVIEVVTGLPLGLPPWLQFGPGGCREGALHLDFIAPSPDCLDYWSSSAAGSFSYSVGVNGDPQRALIVVSCGIPEGLSGAVDAANEYYAFRLTMDASKSTGSGSCPGCLEPACIGLTALWLYQPSGLGDYRLCNPLAGTRILVTTQGGNIGGGGCPGTDNSSAIWPDCAATPAKKRTWGRIKGLYR